ncbi:MAG: hypothetical protein V4850_36665 [Myxococcota bacterium]
MNILLVIARPYPADVGYRSIARPLVAAIQGKEVSAEVTVLPTFARLQEVLSSRPGEFHILHFDGHGGYGTHALGAASPNTLQHPWTNENLALLAGAHGGSYTPPSRTCI